MVLKDDVVISDSEDYLIKCVNLVEQGDEIKAETYLKDEKVILYDSKDEEIQIQKEIQKTEEGTIVKIKKSDGKECFAYLTKNNSQLKGEN